MVGDRRTHRRCSARREMRGVRSNSACGVGEHGADMPARRSPQRRDCTASPLFVFLVLFWFLWFSGSGSPGGPDIRPRGLAPFSLAHPNDHIFGPQPESCKRLRQMSFV